MSCNYEGSPDETGSGGLMQVSRSPQIHLPGARASTYSGFGLLQSLLRHMLRGRCRLGGFARSFVAMHFACQEAGMTAKPELFPMPAPYPEVLLKKSSAQDARMARKKGVVAIVIVLNFLHLNRPRSMPSFTGGVKLSRAQWDAVRRIEVFLEGWLESPPITPAEMGRTAGKVESLEAMLKKLESQALSLAKTGGGYFPDAPRSDQPGRPPCFKEPILGVMETEGMSTFKNVDASRLSFVGRPHFDPTPYLDPLSKMIYNDPLAVRISPQECHAKPPLLRVHCSRQEKIKLFELLDASGRLRVHHPHEVTPLFGSGLFAVTKDLERDRLILDSRGANLLESPPQRWIKSLASAEALCRLQLEEEEVLRCSGNDLRDFYYLFRSTSSRSRRNVLVGAMHPKEIQHLNAVKGEHLKSPCVFGALSSLAMGDCQAVELAQSCHLGLGLQNDIITADNLLTMYKPIPRMSTAIGLVIDDFVALSKVTKAEAEHSRSHGAVLADKMQRAYEEVELIPNTKKAFRDQAQSSFWGVDLDGDRGILRGSLRRAIPLAGILLQLAGIGVCTGDLMQVVVGCLISLFLYRRRFLSLLDSLFASYRGRGMREVFRLDGRARSDLLALACLLPLAATNLRAAAPVQVAASDASNWGEAGVSAKIPKTLGRELVRHCLRKSVWTKLLAPGAAVLRAKGLLAEEDELPSKDQRFETNPLWHLLAQMLDYKLLFAKEKTGQRHINIGELRAGLKTERLIASRRPSSRVLLGLDSQVALGALSKGRSSSPAMNREMVRSIPTMVALDSYLETMYFHTSVNRADQPTRGKEIEKPAEDLPTWWDSACKGDFQALDEWLFEQGLDPHTLSGLPCLDELCGEVSPEGILPTFLKVAMEAAEASGIPRNHVESCKSSALSSSMDGRKAAGSAGELDALPSSTTSARPPRGTAKCGRAEGSPKTKAKTIQQLAPLLSKEAVSALAEFPASQVVKSKGLAWPPARAGFLDLYSGEKGVARRLGKMGPTWSLCFDLADSPSQDLDDPVLREKIEKLISLGCFVGLGGGPVCASFSMAVRPPVRSAAEPYGISGLSSTMASKVAAGNSMALWFFKLLEMGLERGIAVWIENPNASWMFRLPEWKALLSRWISSFGPWTVDYCRFGKPWRKRTKVFTNTLLQGHRTFCSGGHEHLLLKGRSKEHGMAWTRVAQPYPAGVATAVSTALAMKTGLVPTNMSFNPASCAKTGHMRIGEAKNPGPRRPRVQCRTGLLDEVPLVEARTLALQDKIWGNFLEWIANTLSPPAARSAMAHPFLLVLLAKEYGSFLYSTGRSLFVYRHLLVFLQQNFLTVKPFMGGCWTLVTKWELAEPTVHRVPLPYAIFRAMVSIALTWKWKRFAAVLALGFHGIARPGEPLSAYRKELILPRDMMEEGKNVVYLKILKPKTRHRGRGVVQHLSIQDAEIVSFLDKIYKDSFASERLLDASLSAFRRRWDAILAALGIPKEAGLTPGGVRGGGCVHAFQCGVDLPRLLWKMRIKHLQTLESYLQECVASTVIPELPATARDRIRCAAALTSALLSSTAL